MTTYEDGAHLVSQMRWSMYNCPRCIQGTLIGHEDRRCINCGYTPTTETPLPLRAGNPGDHVVRRQSR